MNSLQNNVYPKISIAIPTFNEENKIKRVLGSIFSQDYPKDRLEVFIIDNESTDSTVQIAKEFPIKILTNKVKDAQFGKMLAFKKSTGEYFIYIDADIELCHKHYFKMLLRPLLENPELVGAFTRMYPSIDDSLLNRYLTFDPLQRDVVYEIFSPSIEETIVDKKDGYYICEYKIDKIPPAGRCLFRVDFLLKTPISKGEKFMDLDNLVILVKNGYNKFAYVPEAGYFHHHVESIKELIRKRLRNINRNYLPNMKNREYKWFSLNKTSDVLKIIALIIYAHSLLLPLLRGLYRSIKHKDWAGLLEPIVTLVVTDAIIYGFVSSQKGRNAITNMLKNLLGFK